MGAGDLRADPDLAAATGAALAGGDGSRWPSKILARQCVAVSPV